MLDADILVTMGCLVLGGFTILTLLCGARGAAMAEAQKRRTVASPLPPKIVASPPEVSGMESA